MLLATIIKEEILLWVAVGMAGMFTSTIFGCILLWGSHYVKTTPLYGSLFMIAVAVGTMSSVAKTGYLFDNFSPMWVIYIGIISASLLVIFFLSVLVTAKLCLKSRIKDNEHTDETETSF